MVNILFIDNSVLDSKIFIDSCNEYTIPFLYSQNTTRENVLRFLQENVKNSQIQRLGFVFEKNPYYIFLNNEPFFEFGIISTNTQFLINIINQYKIENIDFLACETLLDSEWNDFYKLLMENTEVIVGASNNKTGNLLFGGDWILESTNTDIELIYFNKSIEYYTYLLGTLVISAGNITAFVKNGDVYVCGKNTNGQLGIGTTTNSNTLVKMIMPVGNIAESVYCGEEHTIVLMTNGNIYGCGYNNKGQLGDGTIINRTTLVKMIDVSGNIPESVACGLEHTIVKMTNGNIYGCGDGVYGQLGDGRRTTSGTLVKMTIPEGNIPKSVHCGVQHTIVLMTNGNIYGCGYNDSGQLGNGTRNDFNEDLVKMNDVSGNIPESISSGSLHTIVKMTNGDIYGCGANDWGQLGLGNGTANKITTLTKMVMPTDVSGNIPESMSSGREHTIVKMTNRRIYGCGFGLYGALGNNSSNNFRSLVKMIDISGNIPESVSCGVNHTIVLMTNGYIYGCGWNGEGQLGDETNINTRYTLVKMVDKYPTITNFSIPTKTFGNSPFEIIDPTSNSTGSFSYTSSNTSVATISGNIITIIGPGSSTITSTQSATANYYSGTITTIFQVNKATPVITNFSIPVKTYGIPPFQITDPTSNSDGSFNYISSNLLVATISGNTITIVGSGDSTITAIQEATANYTSGIITRVFHVTVIINNETEFLYFMNTESTYGNISDSLDIDYNLISSSYKVLTGTGDNITIRKINN